MMKCADVYLMYTFMNGLTSPLTTPQQEAIVLFNLGNVFIQFCQH